MAFQTPGAQSTIIRPSEPNAVAYTGADPNLYSANLALTGPAMVFAALHAVYFVLALIYIQPDPKAVVQRRVAIPPLKEAYKNIAHFLPSTRFGRARACFCLFVLGETTKRKTRVIARQRNSRQTHCLYTRSFTGSSCLSVSYVWVVT